MQSAGKVNVMDMTYKMKVGALKRAARPSKDMRGSVYSCGGYWAGRVADRMRAKCDRIQAGAWSEGRESAILRLERAAARLVVLSRYIGQAVAGIDARKPDDEILLTFGTHYVAAR